MNKQKLSNMAFEMKRIAEDLIEMQKDRELVMPHLKDGKTDKIIASSFYALNKKYNLLLKTAVENNFVSSDDTVFFTELPEESLGEAYVEAALLGRFLRDEEEKKIKVINHCHQDENGQTFIETDLEELEFDEEKLAKEEEKLKEMEEIVNKKKVVVNFKIKDDE